MNIHSKEELADQVVLHSCVRNCMGYEDNTAGCCTVSSRNYIIGPIPDAEDLLERLQKDNAELTYDEVFVGYEEGAKLHPDKPAWQVETSYPALRLNEDDERLPCNFLSENNLCSIHEIRSQTCRNYTCGYLLEILDKMSLEI